MDNKIITFISKIFLIITVIGINSLLILQGQTTYTLTIEYKSFPVSKFEISSTYKGVWNRVDEVMTDSNGIAKWYFPAKAHPGIYKIKLMEELGKEYMFIYNKENITIIYPDLNGEEQVKYLQSKENELLSQYQKLQKDFFNISDIAFSFPSNDKFYKIILSEYKSRLKKINSFVNNLKKNKPYMLVSKLVAFEWREGLQPEPGLNLDERKKYISNNYFKGVDFSDTTLLYFPSINDFVSNYFGLQIMPTDSREMVQTKYKIACDTILNRTKNYPDINSFIIDFIIEGMERIGFEDVIEHIYENYISEVTCDDYDTPVIHRAKKRVAQKKLFVKGAQMPNIFVPDSNNNIVSLDEINAENIVLLFWASNCNHCTKEIPEFHKWYQEYNASKGYKKGSDMIKPLEIFAVSLDENAEEWKKYIRENELDWINVCDFQKWNGQAALKYSIFGTPTYIVMDKDKRLVGVPTNFALLKLLIEK